MGACLRPIRPAQRNVPVASVVIDTDPLGAVDRYSYEFDELELSGYARLTVVHPTASGTVQQVNVTVHKFIGDRTGQLHMRSNQVAYVEYVESENDETEAPCSFRIDDGATVIFPTEVHLTGIRSVLAGLVVNIEDLFVGTSGKVLFQTTIIVLLAIPYQCEDTRIFGIPPPSDP